MGFGYRLHSVDAVSHLNRIEIDFHNPFFAPYPFDQQGEIDFYAFSYITFRWKQEDILSCLLGYGAGATHPLSFFRLITCLLYLFDIKAVVVEKQIILGSDHGLHQRLGYLRQRNPRMFEFERLPRFILVVQPCQHQRRIINRNEFIGHHRQDAGYKQE